MDNSLILATCEQWPTGNQDIKRLSDVLNAKMIPWQKVVPKRHQCVLPWAVWDYTSQITAYKSWLLSFDKGGIQNTASLQLWNMDKRYLLELENKGIPVIASVYLGVEEDWDARFANINGLGLGEHPVIKPVYGQSGKGVARFNGHVPSREDYPNGLLLQPFVSSIQGEICLIYTNGTFSHAANRYLETSGEWRYNSQYGAKVKTIDAKKSWIELGEQILSMLPEMPRYARIDGLLTEQKQLMIVEVELIEPALYLPKTWGPADIRRFVERMCLRG
ncbi:ATP-grasp domain-containing protein [Basilea psittacipulmonis]|uniref:ATP-grasp domain-containing protein n=1 Tax=Basilea psittacipulmonis TaxID=1472345 RepID=UPI00068E9180|nr:hypothetical protein [Basilea psittacipulmonis]